MTETTPPAKSQTLIEDPRPWAFTKAELTAGLRRHSGDPTLIINEISEKEITRRSPSMGKLRGLDVATQGTTGKHTFNLALKEPLSTTRAGTAGEGLREVSFYLNLKDHVPVRVPELIAAHPNGNWLVMNRLEPGRRPEKWKAADYLLAVDQLVALHDRFWGLGEDLSIYPWLAQPLQSDFDILFQAAKAGAETLADRSLDALGEDTDINDVIEKVIANSGEITQKLGARSTTLLHGDYWPGNIHIHPNSSLTVYDWEQAAIGPGVLDLLGFIQASNWWFSPLPIPPKDIVAHYRSRLSQAGSYTYKDEEWETVWDNALLWTFVSGWVDILSKTPDSVLSTRLPALEEVLFKPVRQAAARRLT